MTQRIESALQVTLGIACDDGIGAVERAAIVDAAANTDNTYRRVSADSGIVQV